MTVKSFDQNVPIKITAVKIIMLSHFTYTMQVRGRGKSLSLDVGTIAAGRLIGFGLSLVIPIVLTWYFTPEDYGTYRELSLLILTLQPILLFGIPSSLRYFIPRSKLNEKRMYMTQTLLLSVGVGLCLFFFLLLAGGFVTEFLFRKNFSEFMIVLGAHGFLFITASYIGIVMIVNDDIKLSGLTAVVFSILDVIFMCGSVILFRSVMALLAAIAVASMIKFIIAVAYIASNFQPEIKLISYPGVRDQLSFSAPIGLADIINILNVNIDKYFIAFFFVQKEFAIYSIGALITTMILIIYHGVFDVIVPQFSKLYKKKKIEELIDLWHEGIRKLALLFYPLFIFLLIFAHEIITIIFKDVYAGSVPVLRIYIVMLPLTVTFFHGILLAAGQTKMILKATSAVFVLNIVLNCILIIWFIELGWGLLGPPLATIIANVTLRAMWLYQISNILKRPMTDLFPWKQMGALMGISILAGLISLGIVLLLGFNLMDGTISIPLGYPGIYQLVSGLHIRVIKLITVGIGFGCYTGIFYYLVQKTGLFKKGDVETIKEFLKIG